MHIRIDVRAVRELEELHVIELQRGKLRRYTNTLTSLINRFLVDEVKRERVRQTQW